MLRREAIAPELIFGACNQARLVSEQNLRLRIATVVQAQGGVRRRSTVDINVPVLLSETGQQGQVDEPRA